MPRHRRTARPNMSRFAREKGRRFLASDAIDLDAMAKETLMVGRVKIPRYYFTMHDVEKIGIRPDPGYERTPLGVYGYPLDKEYLARLRTGNLPYASGRLNFTVLEMQEPDKCLAITKTKTGKQNQAVYKKIYNRTKRAKPSNWPLHLRKLLVQAGYTSVYDRNTGTVHINEPAQVCFLSPQSYRVLATLPQSLLYKGEVNPAFELAIAAKKWSSRASIPGLRVKAVNQKAGRAFLAFQIGDVSPLIELEYHPEVGVGVSVTESFDDAGQRVPPAQRALISKAYMLLFSVAGELIRKSGVYLQDVDIEALAESAGFYTGAARYTNQWPEEVWDPQGDIGYAPVANRYKSGPRAIQFTVITKEGRPVVLLGPGSSPKLAAWASSLEKTGLVRVQVQRKKEAKKMTKKNPIGGARYMLRDLDDDDFALLLDASSGAEAMVEARRLTGKRKGRYQVVRITDPALMNPRATYTLLFEHRRGKRGGVMGLPGTEELHFVRHKDYTGRYEPLQMVKARVGRSLLQLTRGSGKVSGVMVLDSKGNEVDASVFVDAYRDVTAKGYRVRGNPARRNPGPVTDYQDILAHLRALQWLSWTSHWQAKGPSFYGDHRLLERLYTGKKGGPDIVEAIDMLGERMVSYFGPQCVDPQVINDKVKQILSGIQSRDPFRALLELEMRLQAAIKTAWQANQESNDMSLGLDDYLMGLANERDTVRYLLQQRIR